MSLQQNQFNQIPVQGQMDMRFNPTSIQCEVDVSSNGGLVPGQAVKMVDSAGGVPKVVEAALDSDEIFGFINYNIKDKQYDAYDAVGISLVNGGNVMYMTASAAIARNAVVGVVIASKKVKTSAGGSRDVGRALDKAAADGDLIRVIMLPKTTTT